MRELQIVESNVDQIFRRVPESDEKRVNHLPLALDEPSKLDQSPFKHTGKKYSKGTLSEQTQLHIRLISADVQCMPCFQKYQPTFGKKSSAHTASSRSFGARILTCEECPLESIRTENEQKDIFNSAEF